MPAFVVDVNVAIVANGNSTQADEHCRLACIQALREVMQNIICIDTKDHIVKEYQTYLSRSGQPGSGDEFMAWLHDNQCNAERCERIHITRHNGREFEEFPNDQSLARFDRSDRKYVAVALGSANNPEVLNAVDSDWDEHQEALDTIGIRVKELCPHCLRRRV